MFIYLIFYHREIVKLDHFMPLSLSYANTVLDAAVSKSTVLQQHLLYFYSVDREHTLKGQQRELGSITIRDQCRIANNSIFNILKFSSICLEEEYASFTKNIRRIRMFTLFFFRHLRYDRVQSKGLGHACYYPFKSLSKEGVP